MSLLLDALRRAEQDSKKRKLADADTSALTPAAALLEPALVPDPKVAAEELTLQEQSPVIPPEPAAESAPELTLENALPEPVPEPMSELAPENPLSVAPKADSAQAQPAPEASFLDFELPADDEPLPEPVIPASLAPRKASASYGRYDRPAWEDSSSNWGALTANPVPFKRSGPDEAAVSGPAPSKPVKRRAAEPVPERHAFAPPIDASALKSASKKPDPPLPLSTSSSRQALLAAGVMAGRKSPKKMPSGQRRRQWLLVVVALLVGLLLSAFLLFGDALFGSSSSLVAVNAPAPAPAPAEVSPPPVPEPEAVVPAASTGAPAVPAPELAAASVPTQAAPLARTPAARSTARETVDTPPRNRAPRSTSSNSSGPAAPGVSSTTKTTNAAKPASLMESAYAAYQAGNTTEATRLYREVLKADATQRDAWLGLAVIAHSSNQLEPAMDAYRRVLRLEPQNATALAGVSSLSRAAGEPQQESRLRELLARSPQEADLNHALALVLSGEQRWSEAQPLFFKAHTLAPNEPQFAYNLAVSLDHMRKSTLAAQYYETALRLAQGKAAAFDESNARTRLAALRAAR
ncbi:tetratricopeptide repeat protein [Polaromonas sp.]|uniref:tetratricopeptide repeat protein n=1 Tax=Polaromonas sp. TaxID=1869339 RepID=UPI003562000D